jgi:hypothetical protein
LVSQDDALARHDLRGLGLAGVERHFHRFDE